MIPKYLLLSLSILAAGIVSTAQQFKNLNFQQLCDTSKTGFCYWDLSWGGKDAVKPEILGNTNSLLITGKTVNSVGFTEQATSVSQSTEARIITVSASIKSDSIEGKGAGLNIGLYDSNGLLLASKDMGGFYSLDWIRGTTGWKKYNSSIICPLATAKIKVGAILFGKGKAWLKDYQVSVVSIANRKPSKLALDFITAACDSIKKNSLVRDSIDMKTLKETALKIAGTAKKYSDCYLAINYLLESLRPFGDEHSFFMKPDEVKNWENEGSQVSKIQFPSYKIVEGCGYISVPAFHGGNQKQVLAFADSTQLAIQTLYNSGIKGWVIDLRQNTGGNMAPMVAGLGPLFSAEKVGVLVDVNGNPSSWYYKDGKYFWDNDTGWTVSNPVVLPIRLPIAVLTSPQTGSSGEAVAISFIGNEKTKSFGQPTWGLTTGNGNFELKDGSKIFIASTVMADRNGNQYLGSIKPDFVVDNSGEKTGNDNVLTNSIKWIKAQ